MKTFHFAVLEELTCILHSQIDEDVVTQALGHFRPRRRYDHEVRYSVTWNEGRLPCLLPPSKKMSFNRESRKRERAFEVMVQILHSETRFFCCVYGSDGSNEIPLIQRLPRKNLLSYSLRPLSQ